MFTFGARWRTIALTTAALVAFAGGASLATGGTAEAAAADCAWIDIGQPGNVYGWNGDYAGQVEQQFDPCDYGGLVYAHFQWYGPYMAAHPGDDVVLVVSSPDGAHYQSDPRYANTKNALSDGYPVHLADPDEWRVGAQWNHNGCVAWGTLHWYKGYDLSGPKATCGSWIAPS